MRLQEFLDISSLNARQFAEWMTKTTGIKITKGRVHGWLNGRLPHRDIIALIKDLTQGKVGPADWLSNGSSDGSPSAANHSEIKPTASFVSSSSDDVHFALTVSRYRNELAFRPERFAELTKYTKTFLIWRSGPDKLCDWFNKAWLEYVGRTMEQEIGNGWSENVHPDDFDFCVKTYSEAFDERRIFTMTYRLRRSDGEYRYILDVGVPIWHGLGVFAGYMGGGFEVSKQQQAEAELVALLPTLTAAVETLVEVAAQ